jgi:hypothetical protein
MEPDDLLARPAPPPSSPRPLHRRSFHDRGRSARPQIFRDHSGTGTSPPTVAPAAPARSSVPSRARLSPEAVMPGMKVTVDSAMRARDVSRPVPEDVARAEAADAEPRAASQGIRGRRAVGGPNGARDRATPGGMRPARAAAPGSTAGGAPGGQAGSGTVNPARSGTSNPATSARPASQPGPATRGHPDNPPNPATSARPASEAGSASPVKFIAPDRPAPPARPAGREDSANGADSAAAEPAAAPTSAREAPAASAPAGPPAPGRRRRGRRRSRR